MIDAYVFFFPMYTLFLCYATYLILFQTHKVSECINNYTDDDTNFKNDLSLLMNDFTDNEEQNSEPEQINSEPEQINIELQNDNDEKNNEKQLTPEEWAFEEFKKTDKYKFLTKYELNKIDSELCNKEKKNNDIVIDYITHIDSIIIMNYDFDNEYFSYWCSKVVPFYILNIIAIKYVNEFNRSYLFLNDVEKIEKTKDGIFIETEKKIENRYIQNHFKHKGKLNELPVHLVKDKKVPKNIDFETFSKMFNNEEEEINVRRNRPDSL